MKRHLITRAAACLFVLSLTACTANGAGTTDTTAGTADSAATAAQTGATDEAAAAGTGNTIPPAAQMFMDEDAYVSYLNVGDYVTPGEYKGIAVTVEKTEVTEQELAYMASYYESMLVQPEEVTGRALQEGDTAQLDYSGRIKETGEVFEGGTAEGQALEIGSGNFIEGFEEGMVGMTIGETRELELRFPDSYPNNPDLAGVDVIFTVTLNGILTFPELQDSHVEALGIEGVTTIEEFRTYLQEGLEEDAEAETKANVQRAVIEKAIGNATYADALPERLVERYVFMLESSAEVQAGNQGMTKDALVEQTMAYEGFTGTVDAFIRERAEAQVKELLLLEAVARAEDLMPTEEELTNGMATALEQTGFETVEEYETAYGVKLNESLRDNLMAVATGNFLAEQAKVTYE